MKVNVKQKEGFYYNRSHHETGIQLFVAVDGEGQNIKTKRIVKKCAKCKGVIYKSRISVSNEEFYHPNCYYGKESVNHMRVAMPNELPSLKSSQHSYHPYILIGVDQVQLETDDPRGLNILEIFEFLYHEFEKRPSTGTAFIGYFLAYDFTQWFKSLPEYEARMLLMRPGHKCYKCESKLRNNMCWNNKCSFYGKNCQPNTETRKHRISNRQPHPVQYGNWVFDIMANKRFRLKPKRCDCPNPTCYTTCEYSKDTHWMYINDVGSFFQSKFTKIIDPKLWPPGTINQWEFDLVDQGKNDRAAAILGDKMRTYNRKENELLQRIMYVVDSGFKELGITLSRTNYYGPGSAANLWLRKNSPTHAELFGQKEEKDQNGKIVKPFIKRIIPLYFERAARWSYYGGWFEIMAHGLIVNWTVDPETGMPCRSKKVRITWEYDINSAYPWIIANLPCLKHGKYSHGENSIPKVNGKFNGMLWEGDLCLVEATVYTPNHTIYSDNITDEYGYIGAMLHRNSKGGINRPYLTEGYYWWHELQAAIQAGLIEPIKEKNCYKWFKYEPCNCPPPMAKVADLYKERQQIKAGNNDKDTAYSGAIKKLIVSLYGKEAQSVGKPTFGNPIYASLITAGCRTAITLAIATHPEKAKAVVMIATDGVYFLSQHPSLILTEELGDWGEKGLKNLFLFKPGVYWNDDSKKKLAYKSRGIDVNAFAPHIHGIEKEMELWDRDKPPRAFSDTNNEWVSVSYKPKFAMTTALQSLMQNTWENAGAVQNNTLLDHTANPHEKRMGTWYDHDYEIFRTTPYRFGIDALRQINKTMVDAGIVEKSEDDFVWFMLMQPNQRMAEYDPRLREHIIKMIDDGYLKVASYRYAKQFGSNDPWSEESKQKHGMTSEEYFNVMDILEDK